MPVYLITNLVNGRYYVGKTIGDVKRRWSHHIYKYRAEKRQYIYNAIRKYGPDCFDIQILSEGQDDKKLLNLEKVWITLLQSKFDAYGYNLTNGGQGTVGLKPKTHCPKNHLLTEDNLIRRTNCTHRACLTCHRERQRIYQRYKGKNRSKYAN